MSFAGRWGIADDDEETRLRKYKNRLLAIVGENPGANWGALQSLAFITGFPVSHLAGSGFNGSYFKSREYFSTDPKKIDEFARRLESYLSSPIPSEREKTVIVKLTNESHVGIRIVEQDGEYLTYPEGNTQLDEEVVERALGLLTGDSAKEYGTALKKYSEGDWGQVSEKTRRTIEEFLRNYLGNTAGLQANIKNLGKALKEGGKVGEHFRNALINQLNTLERIKLTE